MTRKSRPTFSQEFRREAVKLVIEQDYSIREAAEAMGVGKSTMDKWVRTFTGAEVTNPAPVSDEQRRIREL